MTYRDAYEIGFSIGMMSGVCACLAIWLLLEWVFREKK